jgi:PAS domain S-box-containing protein
MNSGVSNHSKILVVEDDEGLNHLIRKMLQREGYRTGQALSGKEAVARIKEDTSQILLLDFFLPDMTGKQVIRALKKEKIEVPLIIMTGNGDEKIAVELMKLGVRDYIIKESGFIDNLPQVIRRVYNEIETEKELARTEKALRESESIFRALVEAAPDSVTATDLEGKIIKLSPRTKELHGYSDPNEILGKNAMELITPEDRERAAINMKKTFEEGCVRNVEYKLLKKDGSAYAGELSAALVRDGYGNPKGFIAIVRDITERKEAERQIMEKEEQFRDLFENANDIIQAVKPDCTFLYVNRAWKETLGYSDNEVKQLSIWDIIHPDSVEHCRETFKKVMAGESINEMKASFKTKEGNKIDVEGSISARHEKGKFLSTRAIFRNVTDHNKAEQEKQSLSDQLFQSEKMQAVGQLAGGIAHDFNNMLFAISGYAEILHSQLNDAKMQSDVTVIIQAVKRAADLNKQLLASAQAHHR